MKTLATLFIIFILVNQLPAQQVISGKSTPTRINIQPVFERGYPPNLFVNLSFEDDNKNGILEANENARLMLTISNQGKGPAQGLKITVKDNTYDPALKITDGQEISFIYPEKSVTITINLSAGMNIKSAEHKLEINVNEHFGYDMDPAFLMMNTYQFQEPQLAFSGLEIFDKGDGTSALVADGQIQPGEQVRVKLFIQNVGQNISKDTKFYLVNNDTKNIYIPELSGTIGDIGIGEVKEVWFTLSPNKRVSTTGNLPVTLSLTNTYQRGEIKALSLPLAINKKPPSANIVTVEADLARLQTEVARFVYQSDRITANIANTIDITQAPPSKTKRPNAVGIIIGIEQYEYFASAPYAANDAAMAKNYFCNVLGIEKDKVWSFANEKVNGNFFDNKFNPTYGELQKAVVKGQTEVFVFYSGHGIPSKNGEKVYLLPNDGRVEAIDRQGYDLGTFYESLNALQAKSITVFMDACFSGMSRSSESNESKNLIASKGVKIKPQLNQPWLTNYNFSVFSSSAYEETSLGFDASSTGLFTYYFCAGLQGLADTNGDKSITNGELFDYISANVKETSVKIRGLQTPQFNGNRDNVLVTF
jgi:hypothetical protein